MKQECMQIHFELYKLKALFEKGSCGQCSLMQQYSKSEYDRLKMKLHGLDNLTNSNPQFSFLSIGELQQSVGILGMYLMV